MTLSKEKQSKIIEAYRLYDGNIQKAAENLDCTSPTIFRYWKKNNFPVKHKNCRADGKKASSIDDESISEIIKAYKLYDGNATVAAKHLFLSRPTVVTYWRKYGFKIRKGFQKESPLELGVSI